MSRNAEFIEGVFSGIALHHQLFKKGACRLNPTVCDYVLCGCDSCRVVLRAIKLTDWQGAVVGEARLGCGVLRSLADFPSCGTRQKRLT